MRRRRIVLCGFGRVGQAFTTLLAERVAEIETRYGLHLELTAAVDIGGAAVASQGGLPLLPLLSHVREGGTVETFAGFGRPGMTGLEVMQEIPADVLVEATPTNLSDGEPGRTHLLGALEQGMDVVSANKGPLVLYYREIHELARRQGCGVYISAATAAALPTVDVGEVCLAGSHILAIEGILNGTTNYILSRMQSEGCTYEVALKAAQEQGIAETDPRLDVEGWDTANKLILIANRIWGTAFGPQDVTVEGITALTVEEIASAKQRGEVVKLIGRAEGGEGRHRLSVAPRLLEETHPLAAVHGSEKAISYLTDTMDRITVIGGRSSPLGAGAALLKDLINASRHKT
ncbi:MAG: homoserine dehydrogenase, partial [Nitrospinota bacterium]